MAVLTMQVFRQPAPLYVKSTANRRARSTGQDRRNLFFDRPDTTGVVAPKGRTVITTDVLLSIRCRSSVLAQVMRRNKQPPVLLLVLPGNLAVGLQWFDSGGFGFDVDATTWPHQIPKAARRGDRVLIEPAHVLIGCRWHGQPEDDNSGHRLDADKIHEVMDRLRPTGSRPRNVDVGRVVAEAL